MVVTDHGRVQTPPFLRPSPSHHPITSGHPPTRSRCSHQIIIGHCLTVHHTIGPCPRHTTPSIHPITLWPSSGAAAFLPAPGATASSACVPDLILRDAVNFYRSQQCNFLFTVVIFFYNAQIPPPPGECISFTRRRYAHLILFWPDCQPGLCTSQCC